MKKLILLSVLFIAMSFNTQEVEKGWVLHQRNNGTWQEMYLPMHRVNWHITNHTNDWRYVIITSPFINN